MKRCGNEQLSFSLLALCGDDLSGLRRQLAANVRSLEELQAKLHKLPSQPAADDTADMDIICSSADNDLSAYQIDAEDIQSLSDDGGKTSDTELSCSDPSDKTVEAWREFRKRLVDEQKVIRSEYETRLKFSGQEPSKVLGRTKDHTAAIHEWVKKLADHGVLKELHEETTYS
jgi:ubiquitin carboxyl-terminal hydrolase L5